MSEPDPDIPLQPLRRYLDDRGLGEGELSARPIGDGHSNLTYLIGRGETRLVLRRPPLGPLAPSANDVIREARLLTALGPLGPPVPEIVAACDDEEVIGAPFYVMRFLAGHVLVDSLPNAYDPDTAPRRIAAELIEAMASLHAVDRGAPELAEFGRPSGYLERQIKRFRGLLEHNATRPLPTLETVARWLEENRPVSPPATVVHGDFRLGNMMFGESDPELTAILDWEMATVGDPLADLGYCTAMWAEAGDEPNPMLELSRVTRLPGFPSRAELIEAYADNTGRDLSALLWYQVLALWKAAIFLEGSYGRYLAGASADPYFASLGPGVELLGRVALARTGSQPHLPMAACSGGAAPSPNQRR